VTASANAGVFVTGTDTGVGKTLVSCAIAAALSATRRVGVYKPVETGCETRNGALHPSDAAALVAAAGARQPLVSAVGRTFALPAAPLVAAEAAGERVDPLELTAGFARVARDHDFTLVEGAGGLLVPIADATTYLDLARALALPVLCVVASRLGCINHALLTLRVLDASGLPVLGFVVNEIESDGGAEMASSNRRSIERFTRHRCLGAWPRIEEPAARAQPATLARVARESLDLTVFG
jgi:dethiobiotin synthetase